MKTTENITVTNARFKKALQDNITPIMMPTVNRQINKAVQESKFQIGVMTKFYPYLDKCEVKLHDKKVICKTLHRCGGDFLDFYTPYGETSFCDKLHEPCVIPRARMQCLILDVNDDSNEQIMVGYFIPEEITRILPAKRGHAKLTTIGESNESYIEFGFSGLTIRTTKPPQTSVGTVFTEDEKVNYANSEDVYTKDEVYTKEEVDELIRQIIPGEDNNDTTP